MRLMCQGRPSRVMRQGSGPGPAHPSITPPVMRPALVPVSPLPDLSLPVSFPRLQVIEAAVVVSLIVAVTSRSVTAPPGLMVQVAAAAAGPAARPAARQAAIPVSGIRTEREKAGNRIGRAYGGRPDPSRPRPAATGPRRPFSATSRPAPPALAATGRGTACTRSGGRGPPAPLGYRRGRS